MPGAENVSDAAVPRRVARAGGMVCRVPLDFLAVVDHPDAADASRGQRRPCHQDQGEGDESRAHIWLTNRGTHCRAERTDGYVEDPKNRRSEGETKSAGLRPVQ